MLLKLAWRNLWRNKKRTIITVSSVVFAVLLSTLADSAERGSWERMIENLVKYNTGYAQLQDALYNDEPSIDNSLHYGPETQKLIESHSDQIDFVVPRIQSVALAATENQTRVAIVTAIDPQAENKMNQLDEKLTEGDFISANDNDILIARGLSEIFKLNVGDSLVLLGQGFQGATASGVYRIKGILDFPIPEMNNNLIFMSIGAAQWFFDLEERLTSLIIMPKNPKHATRVANQLNSQLDPEWYNVLTWEQLLEDELRFMKFDLVGTFIFMMILYIVIAFGLFGTVLTMMIERQREFGMLISLGMKRSRLAITCLMESIFISKTGVIIGLAIAIPIAIFFHHNPIPLVGEMDETFGQFGFEPVLPFSKDAAMFVKQALIVLGLSLLVGLYPVYKVLRLNIMKVKR